MIIKTVNDLKAALESLPGELEVRTVFDAVGSLFYPHVNGEVLRNNANQQPFLLLSPSGQQSLQEIRLEVRPLHNPPMKSTQP